jgi:hypothetical protein
MATGNRLAELNAQMDRAYEAQDLAAWSEAYLEWLAIKGLERKPVELESENASGDNDGYDRNS